MGLGIWCADSSSSQKAQRLSRGPALGIALCLALGIVGTACSSEAKPISGKVAKQRYEALANSSELSAEARASLAARQDFSFYPDSCKEYDWDEKAAKESIPKDPDEALDWIVQTEALVVSLCPDRADRTADSLERAFGQACYGWPDLPEEVTTDSEGNRTTSYPQRQCQNIVDADLWNKIADDEAGRG